MTSCGPLPLSAPATHGVRFSSSPGDINVAAHKLYSAIAGAIQEVPRFQHAVEGQRDRTIDPGPHLDSRIADQRLCVLRRYAREGGAHSWRTRTADSSCCDMARFDVVCAARACRARLDRSTDQ